MKRVKVEVQIHDEETLSLLHQGFPALKEDHASLALLLLPLLPKPNTSSEQHCKPIDPLGIDLRMPAYRKSVSLSELHHMHSLPWNLALYSGENARYENPQGLLQRSLKSLSKDCV